MPLIDTDEPYLESIVIDETIVVGTLLANGTLAGQDMPSKNSNMPADLATTRPHQPDQRQDQPQNPSSPSMCSVFRPPCPHRLPGCSGTCVTNAPSFLQPSGLAACSAIQHLDQRQDRRPTPPAEKLDLTAPSNPEIWMAQVHDYMLQSDLWDVLCRPPITRENITKAMEAHITSVMETQGMTFTPANIECVIEEALYEDARENLEAYDLLYATLKFAEDDAPAHEALLALH